MKKLILAAVALFAITPLVQAEDNFHDFTIKSIDYKDMPLAQFAGKVVLLVNTASLCGFTPQYEGLQKLWSDYKEKGLVVLGVPSNDFADQEPENEAEIKEFCTVNYNIDFPMTKKMVVNGSEGNAPLYDWLAEELGDASRPKWNFHKYLIGAEGQAVTFFSTRVEPQAEELVAAVEAELAK